MKKTLVDYKEAILKLPIKEKYTKEELLIPEFLIERQGALEIYYAPHNEYYNPEAKIFIIGITPGFQQMSTAIAAARRGLEQKLPMEQIQYACKEAGRFSGVIRKNIVSMLDELEFPKMIGIQSTKDLFGEQDHLLYTVSLIPYSVFINDKNYSGHTPKILKNKMLSNYVYENFLDEYRGLRNSARVLLIPLGSAVEEVLSQLEQDGRIGKNQILRGFPHPSGANVNRIPTLKANQDQMMKFLRNWYSK